LFHCRRFDKGITKVDVIKDAKSTVHEIALDLSFHKVSAHWVCKMLTEEHKSKRMAASLENL
jgi:hypothetical protein